MWWGKLQHNRNNLYYNKHQELKLIRNFIRRGMIRIEYIFCLKNLHCCTKLVPNQWELVSHIECTKLTTFDIHIIYLINPTFHIRSNVRSIHTLPWKMERSPMCREFGHTFGQPSRDVSSSNSKVCFSWMRGWRRCAHPPCSPKPWLHKIKPFRNLVIQYHTGWKLFPQSCGGVTIMGRQLGNMAMVWHRQLKEWNLFVKQNRVQQWPNKVPNSP
jgi:hypothetical protein